MLETLAETARWLVLAVALGIFVVTEVLLLRSAWHLWRDGTATLPLVPVRLSRGWELLWTALPALGLLALAVAAAQAAWGG